MSRVDRRNVCATRQRHRSCGADERKEGESGRGRVSYFNLLEEFGDGLDVLQLLGVHVRGALRVYYPER